MKKVIFSGVQSTGTLMIGNYIGAVKNWARMQDEYDCIYCVVDYHALTVRQEPAAFKENARSMFALLIAAGLDPDKNTLYFQSQVSAHAELAWILNCFTYAGELNRMTQYKEKSQRHADNINAGLYTYPVLMAADILLYQASLVPVGEDQKQHLELCRDVALRFNNIYGNVFTVPEAHIPQMGARIMSLQDTDKKMSKSETENPNNVIFLLDPPETIMKKCKRAVTDSDGLIKFDTANKPGISNLLTIYACLKDISTDECEKQFAGMGYGALKTAVGEAVCETVAPIKKKYDMLISDAAYLDEICIKNGNRAAKAAAETLDRVKAAVGINTF
ncbi:MAG: tryptophan--tRNA ligase [Defluviitaleaceae bacterium]|nr:tryptophan--tRNA ligase [Defluviitaleaceae bacterium]